MTTSFRCLPCAGPATRSRWSKHLSTCCPPRRSKPPTMRARRLRMHARRQRTLRRPRSGHRRQATKPKPRRKTHGQLRRMPLPPRPEPKPRPKTPVSRLPGQVRPPRRRGRRKAMPMTPPHGRWQRSSVPSTRPRRRRASCPTSARTGWRRTRQAAATSPTSPRYRHCQRPRKQAR